jgi:effector-binding domain-containing protein
MQTEIIDAVPQRVAIVRSKVPFSGMPDAQRAARRALEAAGAPGDRPLAIWWPPRDGIIDYAPGVVVSDAFEASGPVSLFTLPAGRVAHLTLLGPYDGLPGAWQALFADCACLGVTPSGVNWEIYAPAGAVDAKTDLFAHLV